jgi:hypothetical protein
MASATGSQVREVPGIEMSPVPMKQPLGSLMRPIWTMVMKLDAEGGGDEEGPGGRGQGEAAEAGAGEDARNGDDTAVRG